MPRFTDEMLGDDVAYRQRALKDLDAISTWLVALALVAMVHSVVALVGP